MAESTPGGVAGSMPGGAAESTPGGVAGSTAGGQAPAQNVGGALALKEGRVDTRIEDDERQSASCSRGPERLLERAAQERQEVARGPDASERALAQTRGDDVADDARDERGERRLVAKDRRGGGRPAPTERRRADDHLVEHAAEGPDVAALVGQSVLNLLGGQVRGGARSPLARS